MGGWSTKSENPPSKATDSSGPVGREDRFYCAVPYVSQKQFYATNFLKCYDTVERRPDRDAVIQGLQRLQGSGNKFRLVMEQLSEEPEEYDVIRLYTSNCFAEGQKFYNYLNEQLCLDNKDTLMHLMPFIRRATSQINYRAPSTDVVVYRAMILDKTQKAHFTKGLIFRFPGFTSTSISEELARNWPGMTAFFEIHIYAGCLQVRNVADVSHYSVEQEYLFSPYSLFEVTAVKEDRIVLKAIDNMSKCGLETE